MSSLSYFMKQALAEAHKAAGLNEVPIGAVVVHHHTIIGRGHNLTRTYYDPTAHAEMIAIKQAALVFKSAMLQNCDIYTTLEPCAMCAGAIAHARLRNVYFAAYDPKGGAIDHGPRLFQQTTLHHHPACFGGLGADESSSLLQRFFQNLRQ